MLEKIETSELLLDALSKKCHRFHLFIQVLLVVNILIWLVLIGFGVASFFAPNASESPYQMTVNLASVVLNGLIFTLLLRTIALLLAGVASGHSPFNATQVKRLKKIALLLLLFAAADALFSLNFTQFLFAESVSFGASAQSAATIPTLGVNIGAVFSAIVVYGLAAIFEYGTELQKQSDEVL